jgi:Putative esterase
MMSIRVSLLTVILVAPSASAFCPWCGGGDDRPVDLAQLNQQLKGQVHDYTANHGQDRRITSTALNQKRDVYVYVPPGYDATQRYPLVIWLHGLAQDESSFLKVVSKLDTAMSLGVLPKFVAIAPDGTVNGRASLREPPSLYLNSPLGRFEDFIVYDVWNLAVNNYGIRPEREAHVLAGASMGAFGAYNLGIKHRKHYGVVAGVLPPLNLRYADCRGRTDGDYDPNCTGVMTEYRPNAPVARFGFLMTIRQRQIIAPVFGEGPDVISKVAAENPAEMLVSYNVKPGELEMFAGYGQFDEFNFDAQTESFAAIARGQGLTVQTVMIPNGKHDKETAMMLVPEFIKWLRPKLEPYSPK